MASQMTAHSTSKLRLAMAWTGPGGTMAGNVLDCTDSQRADLQERSAWPPRATNSAPSGRHLPPLKRTAAGGGCEARRARARAVGGEVELARGSSRAAQRHASVAVCGRPARRPPLGAHWGSGKRLMRS
eukprot:scaffold1827_cov421-Prasinococcus_capsulatus_cf.AAC.6